MAPSAITRAPNLRHLQAFREVARLGSVSAAARSVHISQPAVTQAIAGLETLLRLAAARCAVAPACRSPGAGEICLARIERSDHAACRCARRGDARRRRTCGRRSGSCVRRSSKRSARSSSMAIFSPSPRARATCRNRAFTAPRASSSGCSACRCSRRRASASRRRAKRRNSRGARGWRFAEIEQARAEVHALIGRGVGPHGHRRVAAGAQLSTAGGAARVHAGASAALASPSSRARTSICSSGLRSGESDVLIGALRDPRPSADVVQEHLFDDPLAHHRAGRASARAAPAR